MPNYWIVGAAFGGGTKKEHKEQFQNVLESGVWYGWNPKDDIAGETVSQQVLDMRGYFRSIRKGDRIAIKSKNIHDGTMKIRAIGIVKADADIDAWRIYVDWLSVGEDGGKEIIGRKVKLNGMQSTISPPFTSIGNSKPQDDAWIAEIFSI